MKDHDRHPRDEFDDGVPPGGPRGAHRAPRTRWNRWWPFVIVLILFPALAYGAVTWLSDWQGLPGAEAPPFDDEDPADEEPSTEPTDEETQDPDDGEDTAEGDGEEESEPTPTPTPDLDRDVQVLNSTTIPGLAGGAGEQLEDSGFTTVETGNWQGAPPTESVVYYAGPDDAVTAQAVADELGIGATEESAEQAPDGVVVVLAQDFQA